MKFAIKNIVAAAAFVAVGAASAAPVTVASGTAYNGLTFSGSGALSFSADLLGALDTGKVSVANYGTATTSALKDVDGYYTSVTSAAPIQALTIESTTGQVLKAATTGGATQTSPVLKNISSGGSLTVTDLNVDLSAKKVYATLIGANGVGTLNNFYLWDIASVTGATNVTGAGSFVTTISGLSLTADGFTKFTTALGLLTLGKSALQGVTDFGTITSTITATTVAAIPEPSTYGLMAMGLVGMGLVARRRRAD